MAIAIIGANGFVGRGVYNFFKLKFKNVYKILRQDDFSNYTKSCNIILHVANSGKKFEANQKPNEDFLNTVKLTKKIFKVFQNKKIILISTISCRIENNPYSLNRLECEKIILQNKNNLVIRLPVVFNPVARRGILYDIVCNNKVYLDGNTIINPLTRFDLSSLILENHKKNDIIELGSKENKSLFEISSFLKSSSNFEGKKIKFVANLGGLSSKYSVSIRKTLKVLKVYKKLLNNQKKF